MTTKFLIGADPEIFVKHKEKGSISAHELIPGTKKDPFKVQAGAVQIDGTALEFNIEPAATAREFVLNIKTVMHRLDEMIREKDPNLQFDISPTVIYAKALFAKLPDYAIELGCEPDFNAYTGVENERPDSSALKGLETMRTASGHVHIGWTDGADRFSPAHFEDCRLLTSLLDWTLGNASRGWDWDSKRSRLYGKPGAFRPKPYGMEYRVLSNRWLSDPKLAEFVFETTRKVATFLKTYGPQPFHSLLGSSGTNTLSQSPMSPNYYDSYFSATFGARPGGEAQKNDQLIKYTKDGGKAYFAAIA